MMTGIILAGGENSRIGLNKAFLDIGGEPIIEKIIGVFEKLFEEVIIVANDFGPYEYLGVRLVKDKIPGKNSFGGMYSGLREASHEYSFVTACDMPFLNRGLMVYLMNERYGYDVVVPEYDKKYQPLCAVYSKNCVRPAEEQLVTNNLKITDFLALVKTNYIRESFIRRFDFDGISFININTREDYTRYKEGMVRNVSA